MADKVGIIMYASLIKQYGAGFALRDLEFRNLFTESHAVIPEYQGIQDHTCYSVPILTIALGKLLITRDLSDENISA